MEVNKIIIPKGWEIEKIEGNEIILKERKSQLPKIWEECVKIVDHIETITTNSKIGEIHHSSHIDDEDLARCANAIPSGYGKAMIALSKLLICREVYRNGWKPDWNTKAYKYCIELHKNNYVINYRQYSNVLFTFQSAEIRDEFFKNFKDLLEDAKPLFA